MLKKSAALMALLLLGIGNSASAEQALCAQGEIKEQTLTSVQNSFQLSKFEEFFKLVDPFQSEDSDTNGESLQKFEALFPDGFNSCVSLISEWRSQRVIQSVTAYKTHAGEYIFLLVVLMEFDSEFNVVKYHISSTFDNIFDQLR